MNEHEDLDLINLILNLYDSHLEVYLHGKKSRISTGS